jgi:hypothetical protein
LTGTIEIFIKERHSMQTLILLILAARIATSDEGPIEFAKEAFAKIPALSAPAAPPVSVVAPELAPVDDKVVSASTPAQE